MEAVFLPVYREPEARLSTLWTGTSSGSTLTILRLLEKGGRVRWPSLAVHYKQAHRYACVIVLWRGGPKRSNAVSGGTELNDL
jgi:hypothetical protein